MDPIQEILSLLGQTESSDESTARLEELYASLEDAQLVDLETALTDEFDTVRAGDITPEVVTHLTSIAGAIDKIRASAEERIATATQLAADAEAAQTAQAEVLAELDKRVKPADAAPADGADKTADADSTELAVEAVQLEEENTETEATIVVEDADEAAVVETEAVVTEEAVVVDAPVEAAVEEVETEEVPTETTTTPATATKEQIMSRTPKQFAAEATATPALTIRAAGGGTFDNILSVEDALIERYRDLMGTGRHGVGRFRVASIDTPYAADRKLADNRVTDVTDMVNEIRNAATTSGGVESLVADGGICAPVDVHYGLQTIATAGRPLRDAITTFQSKRGGIQFVRPLTLADINAATTPSAGNAIGVITEAQDAASTFNKSSQFIECGDLVEARIDAVYNQLRFGNFMERTFPERVSQFTDLSLAAYARFSEQRLFNRLEANSTDVFAPQELGASRDLLTTLNRTAINYRARNRMPVNATLDIILPAWVGMGLLPDDQTNALQAYPQQFEVTVSTIETWLRQRNINVLAWFQDDFTTAQASGGALNAYPSTFEVLMFHPGAHVLVDGGTLDIGVFRDAGMIADNVFGTFSEEFWTAAMWGLESLAIHFSLCASGASAGSIAPTCGS